MAWQAFFHAYYYKRNRKPWYQSRTSKHRKGVRYERVDGEPKHWDLSKCLAEFFRDRQPPERKNLEFLLGLRNKIEHRDLPQLDQILYGECQAALMNLEDYLIREFGDRYGLEESLSLSLQFSRTRPPEQKRAIGALAGGARTVMDYIERFQGGLNDQILNDHGYSYRVFLVPKVANRENAADTAVEFLHIDEADEEQKARLKRLNVLIKDKHIPIANLDIKKPSEVVDTVSGALPLVFNMHHHTMAWKHFQVRPVSKSNKPERTNQFYCVYDNAHKDYLYTKAWIDKFVALVRRGTPRSQSGPPRETNLCPRNRVRYTFRHEFKCRHRKRAGPPAILAFAPHSQGRTGIALACWKSDGNLMWRGPSTFQFSKWSDGLAII